MSQILCTSTCFWHGLKTRVTSVGVAVVLCMVSAHAQTINYDVPLFDSGDAPTRPFFRVGSLQLASDGSLLAFGEAREKIDDPGRGDGVSDIVVKKSVDGG